MPSLCKAYHAESNLEAANLLSLYAACADFEVGDDRLHFLLSAFHLGEFKRGSLMDRSKPFSVFRYEADCGRSADIWSLMSKQEYLSLIHI